MTRLIAAVAGDLQVDPRDLALTLLAAPVCLAGFVGALVLLIAIGTPA